ncbi:MAG: mucoidy inhibitor MuiA family protein [Candidatus Hodarchaeota archaeon]
MSETKDVETKISNAVIFLDGARVTRKNIIEIPLEQGINILKIGEISKYLDSDSVRVKGAGKGIKATLIDVEVNYVYKEVTGIKELDELQEKLKQLQKELNSLKEELQHFQWVKNNFSNVLNAFSTEFPKFFAAGETSLQGLKDMQTYSNETISNTQKKLFELVDEIEKKNLEINKVRKEIQKFGAQAQKVEEYYDIEVSIEAENAGPFDLSVTYQIRGASWTPSYDVLISEIETKINYRAEIVNKTLEDWDDINLEVSTATFKPVRIIEPQPWYIQERVYYPPAPRRDKAKGRERAEAPMEEVEEELMDYEKEVLEEKLKEVEMKVEQAAFSEDSFGVQHYKIAKKMDIKADGSKHPVLLQEIDVISTRLFYWNSMDQQLIAQEKIKNGDSTLLPGKCKCYVDGDFIGETNIKVISPGEEFKLGARRSYELKVEKKLTKREVGKKGIMKGKLTNDYQYEIKINNYRKKESEITINDRIPHSRSPDIIVDPDEKQLDDYFSPIPDKFILSVATFELKLAAEQEFKIKYGYKVSYNKDITIDPPLP